MKVPEPRKLKSGNYFIQLRLNGVSVPITASTAKECRRQAQLIKAEHRADKRKIEKVETTLGQAIDDYIAHHETVLSPSTVRGYGIARKNRFQEVMDTPIKDIKDWQKVINTEAGKCSPKTLKNSWALVCRALKVEAKMEPPAVMLPQVPVKEIPYLRPDEIKPFCEALKGDSVEIAALLELHGLRRSEVLALTWETGIDLDRDRIKVHGAKVPGKDQKFVLKETNKNKSSTRTVPIMIPQLKEALMAVKEKTGPVVPLSDSTLLRGVQRTCERAGVTQVGNHGLRHSFASLGYHLGLSERQLMELGGWADYTTMHKVYIRIAEKDMEEAANSIAAFFQPKAGAETENANENANDSLAP